MEKGAGRQSHVSLYEKNAKANQQNKTLARFQREVSQTGGGPPPSPPDEIPGDDVIVEPAPGHPEWHKYDPRFAYTSL